MFDPSQQLHDYFVQQGYSDLEAHREASLISGRCPPMWLRAQNQTDRTPVSGAENTRNMETQAELQDSQIIDLGFDVTAEDVLRPVLQGGPVNAEIAFVREENSRVKGTPQLVIGYRTTQETKDVNGKTINPGFTLVQRINRKPSGKQTQQMIDNQIKRVHFAAIGLGRVTTAEWTGKPVVIVVRLREPHVAEDGTSYDASNDIGSVNPVKK